MPNVQSPLTLIMNIKSPADYEQLHALLLKIQSAPPEMNPIWGALNKLRSVHFARFVFLAKNTQLAVITTYDGSFEHYINDFIDEIGDVFNALLMHMADAPPLPVQQNRDAFLAYREGQRPALHRALLQRVPDVDGARHSGSARHSVMATLPLDDVQGLVLRGYGMNALSVFVLRVDEPAAARRALGAIA